MWFWLIDTLLRLIKEIFSKVMKIFLWFFMAFFFYLQILKLIMLNLIFSGNEKIRWKEKSHQCFLDDYVSPRKVAPPKKWWGFQVFCKCEQLKDQSKQFRTIMYQNTQCVSSVGHHSLDPAQPALVSVGPLSVVVQVDMSLKSNLTYTLLTKKSIKMWIVKWSAVLPF